MKTEKELKDAAIKLSPADSQDNPAFPNCTDLDIWSNGFEAGAKWMQEQGNWISVEDRLPDSGSEVLFVYKNFTHNGYYEANEGSEYFSTVFGIVVHKSEIKYWQPLPNPPKEK